MSFANDILDAIEIMVKQVVEDNATKIYTGVCKTTGTDNCVLTINGKDNTVKYYGGVPVVGTVYQVFIPFGNMSAAFIIVPGSGGGSGGGGVDSVNGKTGDVVLNAADVGALPNTTTIPSKTSQLTNDSGFITSESAPVKSVNGKTGDVVLTATNVGALPTSGGTLTGNLTVGSANIQTNGYVVGTWLQGTATNHLTNAATKIAVQDGSGWVYHRTAEEIKSDIGLSNVDNVKQYSASNPPPYPVTSVSGKTGAVTLTKANVGLSKVDNVKQYSAKNPPPYPVVSVNGKTGGVNLVASDVGAVSTDNITQTLGTSTTKVPSEKAVTDAMGAAGYGDMLKSVYDATGAIANGGGIVNYIKSSGFTFLGTNPISSTSDDTTTNWAALGTGYAWYDTTGLLINQPSQWGFVINYKYSGDIFQIWKTQDGGPMYYRSGNASGWGKSWTKILDATDLIISDTQPSGQAVGGIWYQIT